MEMQGNGDGPPTVVPGSYVAAHRMATVQFPTRDNYKHEHNVGPDWLDLRVRVIVSTGLPQGGLLKAVIQASLGLNVDSRTSSAPMLQVGSAQKAPSKRAPSERTRIVLEFPDSLEVP